MGGRAWSWGWGSGSAQQGTRGACRRGRSREYHVTILVQQESKLSWGWAHLPPARSARSSRKLQCSLDSGEEHSKWIHTHSHSTRGPHSRVHAVEGSRVHSCGRQGAEASEEELFTVVHPTI